MRLYLAGPMTGLPDYNYPAFHAAEAALTAKGYDVLNPAQGVVPSWSWQDYMRRALADLITADGVVALPGWEHSRGARLELRLARDLDLPHGSLQEWLTRELRVRDG